MPNSGPYYAVKDAAWNIIKGLVGVSAASTFFRICWALANAPARWATLLIRSLRK